MSRTDFASRFPPFVRSAAFYATLAAVLYLSLCPAETVDKNFSKPVQAFDWLFHASFYVALGALAVLAFLRRPAPGSAPSERLFPRLHVALLLACMGCALELAQTLLPFIGRSCSVSDALHNAAGALLGTLLAPGFLLLPPSPRNPPPAP